MPGHDVHDKHQLLVRWRPHREELSKPCQSDENVRLDGSPPAKSNISQPLPAGAAKGRKNVSRRTGRRRLSGRLCILSTNTPLAGSDTLAQVSLLPRGKLIVVMSIAVVDRCRCLCSSTAST